MKSDLRTSESDIDEGEILYQIDAFKCSPLQAAQVFADSYWDQPRKIKGMNEHGEFKILGGLATYKVISLIAQHIYQIIKLSEGNKI